jgi:hypothetical protein
VVCVSERKKNTNKQTNKRTIARRDKTKSTYSQSSDLSRRVAVHANHVGWFRQLQRFKSNTREARERARLDGSTRRET